MGILSHILLSRTDQKYDGRVGVVGLQALIHSEYSKPQHGMTTSRNNNNNIVHWWYNNKKGENVGFISSSSAAVVVPVPVRGLSSSSSSSGKLFTKVGTCMMGDMIGTESGDYIMSPIVSFSQLSSIIRSSSSSSYNKKSSRTRSPKKTMRDYPPPISSLEIQTAYNGDDTVKMLWVFKREICRDGTNGRLVVKVERVKAEQNDYLETHRENGRLFMKLRHFEDDNGEEIDDEEDEDEEDEDEDEEDEDEDEEDEDEDEEAAPWLTERNCVGLANHADGPNGLPLRPMTTVM